MKNTAATDWSPAYLVSWGAYSPLDTTMPDSQYYKDTKRAINYAIKKQAQIRLISMLLAPIFTVLGIVIFGSIIAAITPHTPEQWRATNEARYQNCLKDTFKTEKDCRDLWPIRHYTNWSNSYSRAV